MIALLLLQLVLPVDADSLRVAAREFGVPEVVMLAVASVESGPKGGNHWRGKGKLTFVGKTPIVRCREIGRMQLSPCEDWRWLTPWCDLNRIRESYSANIRCGAARLAYHRIHEGSWGEAIRRYNGSGPRARAYREKVEQRVGAFTLEGL